MTDMQPAPSLADAEAGQYLLLQIWGWNCQTYPVQIERTTPTRLIVDGTAYWRKNGDAVGYSRDSWGSTPRLRAASADELQAAAIARQRSRLIRMIAVSTPAELEKRRKHLAALPMETLERIVELMYGDEVPTRPVS